MQISITEAESRLDELVDRADWRRGDLDVQWPSRGAAGSDRKEARSGAAPPQGGWPSKVI